MATAAIELPGIPPAVLGVVDALAERGHAAYLVGGCVRDLLRGDGALDFDVATSATTEQLLAQLPDDPFFATYTERAHGLLDQYEDWQVDYMAALRDGDVAQAGVLRRDWELELQEFDAAIGSPLMAVDTWSAEQLVHLRTLLDEALQLLG